VKSPRHLRVHGSEAAAFAVQWEHESTSQGTYIMRSVKRHNHQPRRLEVIISGYESGIRDSGGASAAAKQRWRTFPIWTWTFRGSSPRPVRGPFSDPPHVLLRAPDNVPSDALPRDRCRVRPRGHPHAVPGPAHGLSSHQLPERPQGALLRRLASRHQRALPRRRGSFSREPSTALLREHAATARRPQIYDAKDIAAAQFDLAAKKTSMADYAITVFQETNGEDAAVPPGA
jgi:hypothetical protein